MEPIKNLMFDLGGVIMDIDCSRCVRSFESLGMTDAGKWLSDYGQTGMFGQIEDGSIDADEFHRGIKSLISGPVTDREIDDAFNDFLVGIPVARLEALRRLGKKYNLFLLSNTNPVMWHSKIKHEFEKIPGLTREDYFQGMVTSFEARCLKPSSEIFEYAQQKLGIEPQSTLFLDDSEANCLAAESCGFYSCWIKPSQEFDQSLMELGIG